MRVDVKYLDKFSKKSNDAYNPHPKVSTQLEDFNVS